MEVDQLRRLKPELSKFLGLFDDCFARKDTRVHLPVSVAGQLSDWPRKSVEPIAVEAGVAPRTLQEFLSPLKWDEDLMRDRLHGLVAADHSGPETIGLIDETSYVKKGDKTPGVNRQWCGVVGKTENRMVTVHLGYACGDIRCLLDGELYLPEDWAKAPDRCREAGLPEGMTYRPKWRIALELYDRATANGLRFDWLIFDEGYGSKPDFRLGLAARHQRFVGEVPVSTMGWIEPPRVVTRRFRRRGRKVPRLASGSRPARRIDELAEGRALRGRPWRRWRIKDGEKGPIVWEVKHGTFHPRGDDGRPGAALHLIIARNVLDPTEVKYFLSNAPAGTPLRTLLRVAFAWWRVERCFEDHKGEVGRDHYEGRRYLGLKRHLIISAVSYLFLAWMRQRFVGGKSGADGVPGPYRDRGLDPVLVAGPAALEGPAGEDGGEDRPDATAERPGPRGPNQADATAAPRVGDQAHRTASMRQGADLAL